MTDNDIDELIEILWLLKEESKEATEPVIKERTAQHHACIECFDMPQSIASVAKEAMNKDLVASNNGTFILTSKGEDHARGIIRRHRLAEKLFTEVLEIPMEQSEAASCEFEHILSDLVVDRVCAFLGHPDFCPHNKKIPQGQCCKKKETYSGDSVTPLLFTDVGSTLNVSFISHKKPEVVRKLASFGILPGQTIKLAQKGSAVILAVGESTIAIDRSIAECIYVKKTG
ncbi:MAG: metal-dependent transcriptional regulator [Planctomycetes bacterium]|nr:metal-dependent transcriptional regulator [Planctomycetota bacterium]